MALKALLLGARGAHVVHKAWHSMALDGAHGAHDTFGTPMALDGAHGAHAAVNTPTCKRSAALAMAAGGKTTTGLHQRREAWAVQRRGRRAPG